MNYEWRMKGNSGFMGERLRKGKLEVWEQEGEMGRKKGKNCDLVCILCYKKCNFIVECIPNWKYKVWYVKNIMIFAKNSKMYIPKINCEKWYVFLRSKSIKTRWKYIPNGKYNNWYVDYALRKI